MVQACPAGDFAAVSYADYGDYLLLGEDREIRKRVRSVGRAMRSRLELISRRYDSPTVLDFGSGAGYLCKAAEEFGLHVAGVELSEKLTEFSTTRVGFGNVYRRVEDAGQHFDAIFMTDVIEHLQPAASRHIMTGLLDHLKPGGLLIGNTPNFNSANIRLCGDRDPVIAPPYHQCYFTPQSLDAYLVSLGLKRLRLYSKGLSPDSFLRRRKFEPSFMDRGLSNIRPAMLPLAVMLKLAFKVAGTLLGPWGLGYQLFFVYEKRRYVVPAELIQARRASE
jgi:SAM-dependent methyltransferase